MMRATLVLLAVLTLLLVARSVWMIDLPVPLDVNEGWNAYHAAALAAGKPLYPAAGAWLVNNYPPLSFMLLAPFARVADLVFAGRAMSLLAVLVLLAELYALLRGMACAATNAGFAVCSLALMWFFFSHYVGMNDPAFLAHAIACGGLLLIVWRPGDSWALAGGALLLAAGFFTRQNLIALPLALVIWLAATGRGLSAAKLALLGCFFGGIFALASCEVFGSAAVLGWFQPRGYHVEDTLRVALHWSGNRIVLIAVSLLALARRRNDAHVRLAAIYGACALAVGVFFSGGEGTDRNVLFDADFALAIAVGLAFEEVTRRRAAAGWQALLAGVGFAVAAIVLLPGMLGASAPTHHAAEARREIAFLETAPGPALCTNLAFCFWAKKPPLIDAFNLGQRFRDHPEEVDALVVLVRSGKLAALQLDSPAVVSNANALRAVIEGRYRIDHTGRFGAFMVPR